MSEPGSKRDTKNGLRKSFVQVEVREWGLLATAIIITLLLTAGPLSLAARAGGPGIDAGGSFLLAGGQR